MGGIFAKSKSKNSKDAKAVVITDQDRAVLQLKQQRDKIKQYQKRVTRQLETEKEVARELLRNNKKEKALLILKKKKRMESTLEKAENQLETLEKMVADIEFAQIEVEVVEGLKIGNESLGQLHALMSVEQIESILDETREGVEKQRELDALLGGVFSDAEESDLLSELESMMSEENKVEDLELPEVPDHEMENAQKVRAKGKKPKPQAALAQ